LLAKHFSKGGERRPKRLKRAIGNAGSTSRALIFITKNEKLPKRRKMWVEKKNKKPTRKEFE